MRPRGRFVSGVNPYLRTVRLIRPYWRHVALSVVFTVMFTLLSGVSIWMISPFLDTLFSDGARLAAKEQVAGQAAGPATDRPPAGGSALALPGPSDGAAAAPRGAARAAEAPAERPTDRLQQQKGRLERLRHQIEIRMNALLLRGDKVQALLRICVVFFLVFLAKNVAGYIGSVLMTYVGQRVTKDLRDALFDKFTRLPLSYYHRHRGGELISRATNDVQIANKCVNVSFTNLVRDPIFVVIYLGLAVILSWRLTLVAMAVLPLSVLAIVQIGKALRRYSHRQQEKMANLTSILQETVYGIRVVKAFATERFERTRFLAESERLFHDVYKIARMQRLSSPLSEQLSTLVGLFILWYGGNQVLRAEALEPDLFILFLVAIFSLVHPIKELSQVNNAIQEGMAAAERIFSVLDATPEPPAEEGRELRDVRGRVEFRDVTFGYDAGTPVLRDVDLVVEPGEVVALVGPSGAGKSTLVDLIPRFYDPQRGAVLVDGHDLREVSLASLRRSMGIVTQEVILFNATVRDNIAYGLPEAPPERLEAAARAANAWDFIQRLPQGLDTMIGDRGLKLSGGERQRISIARAILKNPPILIFDEATSALDTESELLVQEAIDRLVRDRTTFVIAHRLSTIQKVDRIYVLQDGRVVQVGPHAALLANGGLYRDLYDLQFRA